MPLTKRDPGYEKPKNNWPRMTGLRPRHNSLQTHSSKAKTGHKWTRQPPPVWHYLVVSKIESMNTTHEQNTIKYVLYARKSSEAEERQALSIDSQIKEICDFAQTHGYVIAEVMKESHSAKDTGARPVFNKMLSDVRSGKFQGVITWAPDRLSRNAGDLGAIVDLMDQKLLHSIRTPSQVFSNTPSDKFLLMILCSQAKLENDNKSVNVKRGLRAKCQMGLRPGVAPLGYLNNPNQEKGQRKINIDPERAPVIQEMFQLVAEHGYSGRDVFTWLKDELNFRTRGNKHVSLSSIYRMLANPFYYGKFEYPKGSGEWYDGDYEAIITKELFERVQKHLEIPSRSQKKKHVFNYTRLIRCGSCDSLITATQKIKTLKSGEQKHYIYYHCSKGKNRFCAEQPISEDDLVDQLKTLLTNLKIDKLKLTQGLQREFLKYQNFMKTVFGKEVKSERKDNIDMSKYAQFVLETGSREDKREFLKALKSTLVLKDKVMSLKK